MWYLVYALVSMAITFQNWRSLVKHHRDRDGLWWGTLAFVLFAMAACCALCWFTQQVPEAS